MNKSKVGMALGLLFSFAHLVWVILVLIGGAQYLLNKIYAVHFLNNPFTVKAFSFGHAIALLVITYIVGYLFGYFYAAFWNWMHKRE